MKDLKHYFISPKGGAQSRERKSKLSEETVVQKLKFSKNCEVSESNLKKKKRKRKENADFEDQPKESENNIVLNGLEGNVNISSRKRKKSDLKTCNNKVIDKNILESSETVANDSLLSNSHHLNNSKYKNKSSRSLSADRKRTSLLNNNDEDKCNNFGSEVVLKNRKINKPQSKKRESDSSKENSISNSDGEEREYSTPESTKNLFSYFNKVDKLPDIEEGPHVIQVEAMVHVPPDHISKKSTPKITKKKRLSKKKHLQPDFDVITSEEADSLNVDVSTPSSSKVWEMRIQMNDKLNDSVPSSEADLLNGESQSGLIKNKNKRKLDETDHVLSKKKNNLHNGNEVTFSNESTKKILNNHEDMIEETLLVKDDNSDGDVVFVNETKKKPKLKNDGTLASFFQLDKKKPLISEQKSAKRQFLNSGAPNSIKRITVAQSTFQGRVAPYPEISHIHQKDKMNILWNLRPIENNFCSRDKTVINSPQWSSILPNQLKFVKRIKKEVPLNKSSLKDLKNELNLYPINCWYKELKKLRKGTENSMWTERYRPHMASSFLANTRNICKLKAWLSELKENSHADSSGSSSDEFVKDDDKKSIEKKTVALLSGLPGIGKTAAVYAIAEEIGYHVLEINASYNRSGKRILNEFSEAMQSHKVGVSKLHFAKMKKKAENPKRSLVLVEDADLLFEDDEGFVSTLISLASSTKRPIILVVNSSRAKHLSKLISLCHSSLHFTPPSQDRLGSWLRTVSTVEGFSLSQGVAAELASTQDIRRALLQLQLLQEKTSSDWNKAHKQAIWERIGDYDFHSNKDRKKAKNYLSSLAVLDIISQKKGILDLDYIPYWKSLPEDSTSNRECQEAPVHNCFSDYESYFLELIDIKPKQSRFQPIENPRNLNDIEKSSFSITNILSRRNSAMDIWPTLRQIARNETVRLASHTKRNNRYFNYLSSVGVSASPDFIQSLPSTFNYLS